jgi:parallel beta-helix repeat protein
MSVVEDVHVHDSAGDGIKVTSLGRDGSTGLKTSQVNSRFDGLFIERSGGHGFHVQDPVNSVTDSNLLNSWISESGKSGVYLENAAGWSVRNNHLYGNSMHGIYANRCYGTSIAGNYVEDFGVGIGGQSGIDESMPGRSNDDSRSPEWFYGIACVPQSNSGSIISDNKVFQLRGEAANSTASFAYIGVPSTHGVGVLNVVNNLVRGANGTRDVGLRYCVGESGTELFVLSQGNNVIFAGAPRDIDNKTTLMTGW